MAAKKIKYLNEYEIDLICMSYRYCIGRHTIAARMHANNIIKNSYALIEPSNKAFIAKDIRKTLNAELGCVFEEYLTKENIPNDIVDSALVWNETAACFDINSHDKCKVRDSETGVVSEVEFFWSYRRKNWNSTEFEKVRIPLESYLKNPTAAFYIKLEDIYHEDESLNAPLKPKKQKMPKNIDVDVLDSI